MKRKGKRICVCGVCVREKKREKREREGGRERENDVIGRGRRDVTDA